MVQEPGGWGGWLDVPQTQQEGEQEREGTPAAADAMAVDPQQQQQQQQREQRERASASTSDDEGEQQRQHGAEDDDEDAAGDAQQEQQPDEQEEEEELDELDLMLQLGVQLEQQLEEVERQGLPAHILARWVREEASRSAAQWQPLRSGDSGGAAGADSATAQDDAGTAAQLEPARIVGLEAVEPCLSLLRSKAALRRLVLGCLELLGAPVGCAGPWCGSNCPTPMQQQALTGSSAAAGLQQAGSSKGWTDAATGAAEAVAAADGQPGQQQQHLLVAAPWYAASDARWHCLVNMLQRLAAGGPCSDWPELCHALITLHACKPSEAAAAAAVQQQESDQAGELLQLSVDGAAAAAPAASGPSSKSGWPSPAQLSTARAAAKQLLSDQRDNLLLFDAYGCLEAAAGQVKTARKVFENALALASAAAAGAAGDSQSADAAAVAEAAASAAPVLALHLAQLELVQGGKAGVAKAHVAVHALLAGVPLQAAAALEAAAAAAASGGQQQPAGLLAPEAVKRARRGLQQRIPHLLASAGGALTPAAAACVAAGALFELLVGVREGRVCEGLDAAAAVYKQVAAAVPEGVRAASPQHEQLECLYCHMLVAAATGRPGSLVPALGGSCGGCGLSADAAATAALVAAVPPVRARKALAAALQLYPHSLALLQLQVRLDQAFCTLAGLRQQLAALAVMSPSPGLWWVALQVEAARPGGHGRLLGLFERALAAPTSLQWQQQERAQRERRQQAWAAAGFPQGAAKSAADATEQRERHQQLLLQPACAAAAAAALLDAALADGYHGWASCCAGLWQAYTQHELAAGRLDAARKLFLRAVHACPGSKALWLGGFAGVCGGLAPRECSGLMTAMQEREVLVRTDVYEVLLASLADGVA
jgi:hypothetical protein